MHDLAVELCRRGHGAVVLTPGELLTRTAEVAIEDGVTVVRVKTKRIKGATKLQRAFRELRLSSHLWRGARHFLLANPCDLILFYSPTIFFGGLVHRLKKLWGCAAYLILRDIFPEWAADARALRRGLIYKYFRSVARQQYEAADVIAVQSPANLEYFARPFPRRNFQLRVLFNWTSVKEERLPATNYRRDLGLQNKRVFLYGGNLGVAQDMNNIVRLASRLASRDDIRFLLVGDGSETGRLKNAIIAADLNNIQIISGLGQQEYLSMVSEFDVGLISLDSRLTTHNIPGKLLSYLYWGLPVLASVNPGNDLFDILKTSGAGFCVVNGEDDQFARAALILADDETVRNQMRSNARRLLESKFSVESAVNRIFGHLSVLTSATACGEKSASFPIASQFRSQEVSHKH